MRRVILIPRSPLQALPGGWAWPLTIVMLGSVALMGLDAGPSDPTEPKRFDPPPAAAPIFVEFDTPPLFLPSATELPCLRDEMAKDDSSVGRTLTQFVRQAEASLVLNPRPLAVLIYEGRNSNDPQLSRPSSIFRICDGCMN